MKSIMVFCHLAPHVSVGHMTWCWPIRLKENSLGLLGKIFSPNKYKWGHDFKFLAPKLKNKTKQMSGVLQRKERREGDRRGMKRWRERGRERKGGMEGGLDGFWPDLPLKMITGVREQTFN